MDEDEGIPKTAPEDTGKFLKGGQQVSRIAWTALYHAWNSELVKGGVGTAAANRIQEWFESAMRKAKARNQMTGTMIELEDTGAGYDDYRFDDGGFYALSAEDAAVLRKRLDAIMEAGYPAKLSRGVFQADSLITRWNSGHGTKVNKPA